MQMQGSLLYLKADLDACAVINVALGLFVRDRPDYAQIGNRSPGAAASLHTLALHSFFSAVKSEH